MEERISITTFNEAVKVVESSYQSKRDALKKKTTLYQGKFMIVKAENNKLRSINKAITKRNKELQEYMVKQEISNYVETITRIGEQPLKLKKEGYAKVPIQC